MSREKKLFQAIKKVNSISGLISGIGVMCLAGVTCFETVSRKVFGHPTIWSFDVSKYLFLFVAFLAFTYAMQEDGHISFDFFVHRTRHSRVWSKGLSIIAGFFGTVFCFFLFFEAVSLNMLAIKFHWMTRGITRIPIFYLYTIMCVGTLVLFMTFLMKSIIRILDLREDDDLDR